MMEIMIAGQKRLTSAKFQRKAMLVFMLLLCMVVMLNAMATPVFADDDKDKDKDKEKSNAIDVKLNPEGSDKLNNVMGFVAGWSAKIGLVVAFFGALQTVLGFMNDDADGKVRGLKTLAAGFMVWGIATSINTFFV